MRDMRHLCGIEVAVRGDLVHLEKPASRFGRAEQPCRGPCMDMGRAGSKRWLRGGCISTDEWL